MHWGGQRAEARRGEAGHKADTHTSPLNAIVGASTAAKSKHHPHRLVVTCVGSSVRNIGMHGLALRRHWGDVLRGHVLRNTGMNRLALQGVAVAVVTCW